MHLNSLISRFRSLVEGRNSCRTGGRVTSNPVRLCAPEPLERRVLMSVAPITIQAEDARFGGAVESRAHAGFTGDGFVDYTADSGGFVSFAINDVPNANEYILQFRYANGARSARSLRLEVNGRTVNPAFGFQPT